MTPRIVPADNGRPTLVARGEHLEDRLDPEEGARVFTPADKLTGAHAVVLFGAGLGYRVRRLRALEVARLLVFEPDPEILALARSHDPGAFEGVRTFTDPSALTSALVEISMAGHRTLLLTPPPYQRAFAAEHRLVLRALDEAEGLKQVQKNSVIERYEHIVEAGYANLGRLASAPLASKLGRPLEGCPAFIVSAGPSLDENVHLLAEAAEKGAIFAVNTSAPAVVAAGAPIDVLTTIEALDLSEELARAAPHAKLLAIDLTAHPAAFAVPARARTLFSPATEPFVSILRLLGGEPLVYGASVATAAFALAREWGADPIVLVGQDLAFTGGRYYASHTGPHREPMRASYRDGVVTIELDEGYLAAFRAQGVKEPPRHKPGLLVPAWGGEGEVPTAHDMILFLRWFENAARALGGSRRLVNATEGGAHIEGFREARLADVLAELGPRRCRLDAAIANAVPIPSADVERLRTTLLAQAKKLARAAEGCMSAKPNKEHRADRAFEAARAPLVEIHATSALMRLADEKTMSLAERRRRTFAALRSSARRVATALETP